MRLRNSEPKQVIVRQYHGSGLWINWRFGRDAAKLAERGYVPTSQSFVPGSGRGMPQLIPFWPRSGRLMVTYQRIDKA